MGEPGFFFGRIFWKAFFWVPKERGKELLGGVNIGGEGILGLSLFTLIGGFIKVFKEGSLPNFFKIFLFSHSFPKFTLFF